MNSQKQKLPTKMPDEQFDLIKAMQHISFEMNRYLFTARPCSLPRPYPAIVAESCLLHSRNVGEFFFEPVSKKHPDSDIRLKHYYDVLTSKDELEKAIAMYKPKWGGYKDRINKKLSHLTSDRVDSAHMSTQEKDDFNFNELIQLFENGLPNEFKQSWELGKEIALR